MANQDNHLVKKAGAVTTYTPQQIKELQNCMDAVEGPMYFMENFMYIQHPTKGAIKFDPFDYQRELLHCYHNYRSSINMLGRQMGKCLCGEEKINIRNKRTGEIQTISVQEFEKLVKKDEKD